MEEAPRPLRESLKRVAVTLKESGVPFALGGSYACWARGGPGPVHDVNFMVMPDDVPRGVEALTAAGPRAVDPPEDWLAKVTCTTTCTTTRTTTSPWPPRVDHRPPSGNPDPRRGGR